MGGVLIESVFGKGGTDVIHHLKKGVMWREVLELGSPARGLCFSSHITYGMHYLVTDYLVREVYRQTEGLAAPIQRKIK